MKRWIALTAGLLIACSAAASESVRFGSKVITVGMSEGKVYQIAGTPDRKVEIETKFGGAVGYRLEYDVDRKTIQIVVSGGRVVDIEELY